MPEPESVEGLVARWDLRAVDGGGEDEEPDEPIYDGMETRDDGEWVRWEDAAEVIEEALYLLRQEHDPMAGGHGSESQDENCRTCALLAGKEQS